MNILTRGRKSPPVEDFAAFVIIDAAALVRGHVKVLLIQDRDTGERFWKLPGGKKKAGENWHTAAAREVAEEIGITIDPRMLRRSLFSVDIVEGESPHQFVVFTHRDQEFHLGRVKLSEEGGVTHAALFDEPELVGLLNSGLVLLKHVAPVQEYLVAHEVLLR